MGKVYYKVKSPRGAWKSSCEEDDATFQTSSVQPKYLKVLRPIFQIWIFQQSNNLSENNLSRVLCFKFHQKKDIRIKEKTCLHLGYKYQE